MHLIVSVAQYIVQLWHGMICHNSSGKKQLSPLPIITGYSPVSSWQAAGYYLAGEQNNCILASIGNSVILRAFVSGNGKLLPFYFQQKYQIEFH